MDQSDAIARFTVDSLLFSLHYSPPTNSLFIFHPTFFFFLTAGIECVTEHNKFEVVCLDTDVLNTALVGIHNARCNPLPDPIENRSVNVGRSSEFVCLTDVSPNQTSRCFNRVSHCAKI